MKKILVDEEELGQEISCINVIYNRYLKSPWPDVNEESANQEKSNQEENEHERHKAYAEQKVLPPLRKTNPCIWCIALMCSLIAVAIILSGLAVLTVYLLFHPKLPKLDVTKASLNRVILDPATFLYNSEMVALITVNNPNGRVDMRYEYINFKLFFRSDMVATQVLPPFAQRRGNSTDLKVITMVSNDAEITPLSAQVMEIQAKNNSIEYKLVGNLRTVARLGATAQIPYWLNVNCQLHFTTPPNGVLHDHKCSSGR